MMIVHASNETMGAMLDPAAAGQACRVETPRSPARLTASRIKRGTRNHRMGFTLLELLVVISIIVVLMSIVLAVGSALGSATNKNRTEATMEILKGALQEWEAKSGRMLTWGTDGELADGTTMDRARYDMQSTRLHVFLITEMLGTVARGGDIREVLGQIDDEHLLTYRSGQNPEWLRSGYISDFEPDSNAGDWQSEVLVGGLTVLDAWDRPIRFIHPGRKWTPNDLLPGPDSDGTIRTPFEDDYGVCVGARPYFVSGGPDQDFGDLTPSNAGGADWIAATEDNIYSYKVEKP